MDPVSIEDWVANRELFGPVHKPSKEDEELEKAYSIESGNEISELLLFKIEDKALDLEVTDYEGKVKKMKVDKGDFLTISPNGGNIKLRIRGKNETTWEGGGKQKIVIEAV